MNFERFEDNPYNGYRRSDLPQCGYSLEIMEPDYSPDFRYTMTGQIYGFGMYGGNHDAEEWLREKLPEEHRQRIVFDSEEGQFFCHSDSLIALKAIPETFDEALDVLVNAREIFL